MLQDLNVLVISGGPEHSEAEHRGLPEVAGLRFTRFVPAILLGGLLRRRGSRRRQFHEQRIPKDRRSIQN
jgi:hypothetical protein